jgi:hypothetical protein
MTTTRVSLTSAGGEQLNGGCRFSSTISADGSKVAFDSEADNLVAGDTNGMNDVFFRDLVLNTTEVVSVPTGSTTFVTDGFTSSPTISPDGRFVGFDSTSMQLDSRNTSLLQNGFLRDRQTGTTTAINLTSTGQFGSVGGDSDFALSHAPLFANGGVYVFESTADDLVFGDTNDRLDVFATEYVPPAASPMTKVDSTLCASLKKKLKKLKKKLKRAKKAGKVAAAKKLKKKIKKIKKKLKALGC